MFDLEDHGRPREPVNIYAHTRLLLDLNSSLGICAKRLHGLAFIESLRRRPIAAILSSLMAHGQSLVQRGVDLRRALYSAWRSLWLDVQKPMP